MNQKTNKHLIAHKFYSGFEWAHDTYAAISAASDGKIYYVLCAAEKEIGGRMCVYDPANDSIDLIGDLNDFCGQSRSRCISQGKSHVPFFEKDGVLYFATHVGYYEMIDGMERLPVQITDGCALYPGGHFLAYDSRNGTVSDLATVPGGEGVLTMTMDYQRDQLYGITWPSGNFVRYDIHKDRFYNLGPVSMKGEGGKVGHDYRVLCRSMFIEPQSGHVFFSIAEGDIFYYSLDEHEIKLFDKVHLRLDYFGKYRVEDPGTMAYNWRKIFWHPREQVAYGIHGNSGYLFRFDVHKPAVEIVARLTSMPSKRSGMYDQFSYGYLGFMLGPDLETIYYLTGGPIYEGGKRVEGASSIAKGGARGLENLHLITFHIPTDQYIDHGPIFYEDGGRPTYVNSIAVADDGDVYTLARMDHDGRTIQDLVRIKLE